MTGPGWGPETATRAGTKVQAQTEGRAAPGQKPGAQRSDRPRGNALLGTQSWETHRNRRFVLRPRGPRRFGSSVTSVCGDTDMSAFLWTRTGKHLRGRVTGTPVQGVRGGDAAGTGQGHGGGPPRGHVLEANEGVEGPRASTGPNTVHTSETVDAGKGPALREPETSGHLEKFVQLEERLQDRARRGTASL